MKQSEEKRQEQLSALLDNALDEQQLQAFMQDLKRDTIEDAETAQRYRIMGDAMRDELDQVSFMDISGAVHRAIEQEPEYRQIAAAQPRKTFDLSAFFAAWLKPVGGLAVAASVAMLTVLSFGNMQNEAVGPAPAAGLAQSQSAPLQRVNPEIARNVLPASTLKIEKKSPAQQRQLNRYMLQHSAYASHATMQDMMPYVRAAELKAQERE